MRGWGGGMQKLVLMEEVDRVACAGSSRVRIVVGLRKTLVCFSKVYFDYWVVQAELLTPLTFVWHCLSRLAAFTSGVYFPQNGRQ